ncbi:MAG: hypothetical protein ACRDS0_05840 [Pseudonocardiaceae bacterium]
MSSSRGQDQAADGQAPVAQVDVAELKVADGLGAGGVHGGQGESNSGGGGGDSLRGVLKLCGGKPPEQRPARGGINSLVQAAKARARGYHNKTKMITIVYLIAAKLQLPTLTNPTPAYMTSR